MGENYSCEILTQSLILANSDLKCMSVTQRVEEKLVARLVHSTLGYNAQITALAAGYGLDPADWQIDFGEESKQFFIDVDPEDTESEELQYPCAALTVNTAVNQDLRKGPVGYFSGTVRARLQVEITNALEKLPRVASAPAHLVDQAMYSCFCSRVPGLSWRPGSSVIFGGNLSSKRGDWRPGGENWVRTLVYDFQFEVEA